MFKLARSHNWLIFAIIIPALRKVLRQYAGGKLLDIGCGTKPYRLMVKPYVSEHIGVDHAQKPQDPSAVDVCATAYEMPFPDSSFDTALCTDVLEHLEDPQAAVSEAYRVVKPGGRAIYTVPLFWHIHEPPRDFYRYTEYGLRYLFENAGFEVIRIEALTGFVVTFSQELVYYLYQFRRGGAINPLWWIVPVLGTAIQATALVANKFDRSQMFTAEYLAVVQRPQVNVR